MEPRKGFVGLAPSLVEPMLREPLAILFLGPLESSPFYIG